MSDAEGVWSDPGDPWIQSVYDVVAPVIGERPVARAAPYFTDAAALVARLRRDPHGHPWSRAS